MTVGFFLGGTTLFHPVLSLEFTEAYTCAKAPVHEEPHRKKMSSHDIKFSNSIHSVLRLPQFFLSAASRVKYGGIDVSLASSVMSYSNLPDPLRSISLYGMTAATGSVVLI